MSPDPVPAATMMSTTNPSPRFELETSFASEAAADDGSLVPSMEHLQSLSADLDRIDEVLARMDGTSI